MRYLLMALVIAAAMLGSGAPASAHGRGPRCCPTRIGVTRPYARRTFYGYGYGYNNPYSVHFMHPYPHNYGRWDMSF